MIDKKISVSEQVDNLSMEAKLIFTWSIPHADDIGLLPYSQKTLKAMVVPMIDMNLETFGNQMEDIVKQGLMEVYEYENQKFYRVIKFLKNQTLKKDRKPNTLLSKIENWEQVEKLGFHLEYNGNPSKVKISKVKIREDKLSLRGDQEIINYFFTLKGWKYENTEKGQIIFRRYLKPAKDLLFLCEENIKEAKSCLDKISEWAKSREIDWSIETIFKKWYELDTLKPKEKKPYIKQGNELLRAFKMGGGWFILNNNGEKLSYSGSEKNFIWK